VRGGPRRAPGGRRARRPGSDPTRGGRRSGREGRPGGRPGEGRCPAPDRRGPPNAELMCHVLRSACDGASSAERLNESVKSPVGVAGPYGEPSGPTMGPMATAESGTMVGREEECAAIDRLLEVSAGGESSSLVLRGEAGIGKTSLLSFAAERGRERTV